MTDGADTLLHSLLILHIFTKSYILMSSALLPKKDHTSPKSLFYNGKKSLKKVHKVVYMIQQ